MELVNRVFNGKQYTLVDIYDNYIEGKLIYHFMSENDELFFEKKDEKFELVKDEKFINDLKEFYGLNEPEIWFSVNAVINTLLRLKNVKKFDKDERKKIIDEQLEKLKEIDEPLDHELIKRRTSKLEIASAEFNIKDTRAFYHPANNSIYLDDKDINNNRIDSKMTRLHEFIHAVSFSTSTNPLKFPTGLLEGQTESIVTKLYSDKKSGICNGIWYNHQLSSYDQQLCIIRQMECALCKKSYKSTLEGNLDFYNEFIEKYGLDIFLYISHRATRMIKEDKIKDIKKYLSDTQNLLLKRVFDKDFEGVNSIETADKYLEKLKAMGYERAKVKNENTYELYYNEKLEQTRQKLLQLGCEEKDIDNLVDNYKYEEPKFFPMETKEESIKRLQKYCSDSMSLDCIIDYDQDIDEQLDSIKAYYCGNEGKTRTYFLVTKNGKPVYMQYGNRSRSIGFNRDKEGNLDLSGSDINLTQNDEGEFIISGKDDFKMEEVPYTEDREKIIQTIQQQIEKKEKRQQQKEQFKTMYKIQKKSDLFLVASKLRFMLNNKQNENEKIEEDKSDDDR